MQALPKGTSPHPESLQPPERERDFEQKLMELYQQFQQAECSLGYLAEQLGISPWEAMHLLEERGLRVANLWASFKKEQSK